MGPATANRVDDRRGIEELIEMVEKQASSELYGLLTFNKEYTDWWAYLFIATIPAVIVGFLIKRI